MIRRRVAEGVERPATTIIDATTVAEFNNLSPADFPSGAYVVDIYGAGGAGGVRYQSSLNTQGAGERGDSLVGVFMFIDAKPVASIDVGNHQWDGTKAGDTIFNARSVRGGNDGASGPGTFNPNPAVGFNIPRYRGVGSSTVEVSRGGFGWRSTSQQNTTGQSGAINRILTAGVL